MKLLNTLCTTLFMLLMWPWWTLKACVMSAFGVSLIVARQILDLWAGQLTDSQPARRKTL